MKSLLRLNPIVLLSCLPLQSLAQDDSNAGALADMISADSRTFDNFVADAAQSILKNQLPFLSLRHIDNDNSMLEDGYAVDYDWSRAFSNSTILVNARGNAENSQRLKFTSYDIELSAKGSYAWSDAVNNENLSKFGVTARYLHSSSEWNDLAQTSTWYGACVTGVEPGEGADETIANCWLEFITPDNSQDAFAYELGLDFHTEGNQDFTDKQDAYGAHIALSYEPGRDSSLQKLNVFDYPFRWLRNYMDAPYFNASLPTMSIALEQVDPGGNSMRTQLGDASSTYDRAHFVSAFSTRVGAVYGYPITFEWIYQQYAEVDAPKSVKSANLHNFEHNEISLYVPLPLLGIELESESIYLRYTSGALPFDRTGENAIVIGWQSNLSDLFGRNR